MAKLAQKQRSQTVLKTTDDGGIRAETKNAVESINRSWVIVYKNLYIVERDRLYEEFGFDSMEAYCKEELNLEYMAMRQKIQVGRTLVALGITSEMVEGITEWTKFKAALPLLNAPDMTEARISEVINSIKDKSYREIQAMALQTSVEVDGGRHYAKHKFTCTFVSEQWECVRQAINQVKTTTGLVMDAQALEYICLEWQLNNNQDPNHVKEVLESVHGNDKNSNRNTKGEQSVQPAVYGLPSSS